MIEQILNKHGFKLTKKNAKESAAGCPFCGGKDRFCVWPDDDKFWCRQCDKKGDSITLEMEIEGKSFEDACISTGQEHKLKGTEKKSPPLKPKQKPKIIKTYDYTDDHGNLLFQVCRFEPKDFRQRRPGKTKDWVWDLKDTPIVLYQLPKVISSEYIFFCEGEKDVDNVSKLGIVATTNPMGAGKLPGQQEKYGILNALKNKRVYVLPDNDIPGKNHAEQLANILIKENITPRVKILELPVNPHGDVSDLIKEKGIDSTSDIISELAKKAGKYKIPSSFITAEELDAMEFEDVKPIISRGVLPSGERLLIAGEGGVGKSLLRLEIAIHLVMGRDWLSFKIPTAKKVVIFQYENSDKIEQRRLWMIRDGMGIEKLPTGKLSWIKRKYRYDLTKVADKDQLLQKVKDSQAEIVMYDCLTNLHSANENDNVRMRNVLDSITDIDVICNTSSIMVHHFGKPQEGATSNQYRTRGASSIIDWCGCALAYTKHPNENKVLRKIEFLKVRDAPDIKPFIVERNGHFVCEIVDMDSRCPPQKIRQILEEMGGEVESQKELIEIIMEDVGCVMRSAKTYIEKAVEMQQIYKIDATKGHKKRFSIHGSNPMFK